MLASKLPTLSAVVVVHNEEQALAECLARLDFADEIVVVLDRCTDGSRRIAVALAHKLVEGAWPIEGDRRNLGVQSATGDWILDVDADERVSPEPASEIRKVITTSTDDYHAILFDNYVGSRLVRHGWGATVGITAKSILFRRGVRTVGRERVHPRVRFSGRKGAPLQQRMIHHIYRDVSDMLRRLDRYTTLRALDLQDAGTTETVGRNIGRFFARFYKCYVRRQGYREGRWGFLIALLAGLFPLLSYLKLSLDPTAHADRDLRTAPGASA